MPGVHEEVLRKIPLFRRLSMEDLGHLAAATEAWSYPRGAVVFSEGDPSDSFYTVARGRVKVYKVTPAGKDIILEIFGAGDPQLGRKAPAEKGEGSVVGFVRGAADRILDEDDRITEVDRSRRRTARTDRDQQLRADCRSGAPSC